MSDPCHLVVSTYRIYSAYHHNNTLLRNIFDPYLPQTGYNIYGSIYSSHRLVRYGSYNIFRPQKVTTDYIAAGYYGEVWMRDSLRNEWYRLVSGAIRSAANYLSELPEFKKYLKNLLEKSN